MVIPDHTAKAFDVDLQELNARFANKFEQIGRSLLPFAQGYLNLTQRQQGPFAGCLYCPLCT